MESNPLVEGEVERDALEFAVEEAMRQIAWFRSRSEKPIRIRLSEGHWRMIMASNGYRALRPMDDEERRPLCGLPLRIDREWDGPLTVETVADQKPATLPR